MPTNTWTFRAQYAEKRTFFTVNGSCGVVGGGRTSAKPIREVKGDRMSRDLARRRVLLAPLCLRGAEVIDGLKQNTIAKSIPLFQDGWT